MKNENICLTMIVKNESAVIERCLKAAEPFFNTFCIHDTGSTDNTMELIANEMKRQNKTGILAQATWSDFGQNRTAVFEMAAASIKKQKQKNMSMLVLDADDIITGERTALTTAGKDAGEISIKSGPIKFNHRRLFNMKRKWAYIGKLHEYPTTTDNDIISTNVITGVEIHHSADGGSWIDEKEKYNRHVDVMKSTDLTIPRNQFYLAQSLRSASRFHEAIIEYKKRAHMKTGWEQEAVYSMLMAARIEQTLGEQERAILDYMNCYEMDNTRCEALHELLCLLRASDNFNLGLLVGEKLIQNRYNDKDGLFEEEADWQNVRLQIGVCYWYTGDKEKAKKEWTTGINYENTINESTKTLLLENMKWVDDI